MPFISVLNNVLGVGYWDKNLDRSFTTVVYAIPNFAGSLYSVTPNQFKSIIGGY